MRLRCKISIPLICVAAVFAIALAISNAFAQSPAASSQAASAAPSAVVTTAPQPAAATSPSAAHASTGAHSPDARAVISYLSDVINWYGHLGVEAQLGIGVADAVNGVARDAREIVLMVGRYLAGQHDQPGGHQRFGGHPAVRVLR